METEYLLKEIYYSEPRKSQIRELSLGYYCGDEITDFQKAKNLTRSQMKTLCAKNNIRYITKA